MSFVIPFDAPPALPVVGESGRFPLRRVFCVGRNYAEHAREMGHDPDREAPFFFMKPAWSAVPGAGVVPYPPLTGNLHHEIEFVAALAEGGRDISPAAALELVFGYAVGVDLTRRDLQGEAKKRGRPWDVGKGFDAAAPISALRRAAEIGHPEKGAIWLAVNGEGRQSGDLDQMIWSLPEVIAELSRYFAFGARRSNLHRDAGGRWGPRGGRPGGWRDRSGGRDHLFHRTGGLTVARVRGSKGPMNSIWDILRAAPAERPALGAVDRPALTYGGLCRLARDLRTDLRSAGLGPGDRVAVVLPNGPEMAAVFLGLAGAVAAAPLNPAYRQEEFAFYTWKTWAPSCCWSGGRQRHSAAIAAAESLGIPIWRLEASSQGPAGLYLRAERWAPALGVGAWCGAVGSGRYRRWCCTPPGTTSRPKIVPLANAQPGGFRPAHRPKPCAWADGYRPEHHAAVSHPRARRLLAGLDWPWVLKSICTPGFNALKIFSWLATSPPDLGDRGADHASGHPRPGGAQPGNSSTPALAPDLAPPPPLCRRR